MTKIVSYAVGMCALVFVGYVILAVLGRPTDALLPFTILLIGQTVTGVMAMSKVHEVDKKVDDVQTKVDGVLTNQAGDNATTGSNSHS